MKIKVSMDLRKEYDSMWMGAMLDFTLEFQEEYPFLPPTVKCTTPVYHPNIDGDGNVWLNMLTRSQWNPKSDISDVLRSLYVLFVEPDENA